MTEGLNLSFITALLSIAVVVMPVVFGFVLWKLSQIFASKEELIAFSLRTEHQLEAMRKDVVELLQRTADQRNPS